MIELLVVIAIIAILAAMLLPALNGARDRARTIGCANTMKTLGTAATEYAMNYNEYWVPYNLAGTGKWYSANTAFLKLVGLPDIPAYPQFVRRNSVCGEPVRNPYDKNVSPAKWADLQKVYGLPVCGSYDAGEHQIGEPEPNASEYVVFRLNKIKSPSTRFGFLETTDEGRVFLWCSSLKIWLEKGWSTSTAAYRHHGGRAMNITFFDGHVECRDSSKAAGTYTPTDPTYHCWWTYL